jgi:lipopolysaccharide biosynthesis glycosyltransferase
MENILVAGNLAAFPDILSLVISLRMSQKDAINLTLLSADLSDLDERYRPLGSKEADYLRSLLQEKNPASLLSLRDLSASLRSGFPHLENFSHRYTPYSLLRLFADSLGLAEEKILYLDTDILVKKPLDELFQTNLQGYDLALVKDPVGAPVKGKNYGNSGVLLLNLPRLKADGAFARSREWIASKKRGAYDQDAINVNCQKLFLPRIYNEQKKTDPATVIRHYPRYLRVFPYPHDQVIRPSNPDLFRRHYKGEEEELLQEFEKEMRRYRSF